VICSLKISNCTSQQLTTRVVAGSQQNATGSLPHTDQITGSRGAEDAVLTHEQLLDTVSGTNLCDLLNSLGVVVTAVTGDDEGSILSSFRDRQDNAGHKGFSVVSLLEDLDLLTKTGAVEDNPRLDSMKLGIMYSERCRTYVPGFWSWKGWMETVWTDIMALLTLVEKVQGKSRPLIVTDN